MKICHVCGAGCDDNAELCRICGAEFVESEENPDEDGEIILKEPVLAASIEDFVTAQIYCDMLAEEKIPYSMGESAANGGIQLMFGGSFADIDIYVDKCDYGRSQDVYEKLMSQPQEIEDFDDTMDDNEE